MRKEISKSDLSQILDIINEALIFENDEQVHTLIDKTNALIEFTRVENFADDSNETIDEKMAAFQKVALFPEKWEKRYNGSGPFLYENITATAHSSSGLVYWDDYAELRNAAEKRKGKSKEIMTGAATCGEKEVWVFSMKGRRSSERAILSLGGGKYEKRSRSRKILEYVSPHLCLAAKRVIREKNKSLIQLTSRETEVISWTADGKTAWEISKILNISPRTVEFHMGNIMDKLDAANSQNAIAIALSNGLIEY
jgi:DNA-binding CsgD family transcriptional regulator